MTQACCACSSRRLELRWRVRGGAGAPGLAPTTTEFGRALDDIVRCVACGHMQLQRMPDERRLARDYAEAASPDYIEEAAGQRATARRVLERVERHVEPGPLVDLGCWVGFLVAEADARGWDAVGIEPSRFASAYARDRLGLDVRTQGMFEATLPERHFRAVVMGDVVEHLADPGAALERARTLLAPAGALVLMLPDAGSTVARLLGPRWWSVIPTHVQYFTRHSVALLLDRHGFEVVTAGTDPKSFSVRYYLAKAGGYSKPLSHAAVRTAERLGLAGRTWAPDFRDRMLLIATSRDREDPSRR